MIDAACFGRRSTLRAMLMKDGMPWIGAKAGGAMPSMVRVEVETSLEAV